MESTCKETEIIKDDLEKSEYLNKIKPNKFKLLKFYKIFENVILDSDISNIDTMNKTDYFGEILKSNLAKYKDECSLEDLFDQDGSLIKKNFIINNNKFIFRSYPENNYLLHFCHNLIICKCLGCFIFEFMHLEGFNNKTDEQVEIINPIIKSDTNLEEIFQLLYSDEQNLTNSVIINELKRKIFEFLIRIGHRGFMTLLGLRNTPGSITSLPPEMECLINGFKDLHTKEAKKNKKPSVLAVGARALCKHSHRSSEGFWPDSKGTEEEKNRMAEKILEKFLHECIWINIHSLPHEIPIVELRNELGYGIRWEINGVFRGFLEPQMKDGHDKGWKH